MLLWVGLMMLKEVRRISFVGECDIADAVSAFLAMVMMPFTYSIANGILFGIMAWVILKVAIGKWREIPVIMWICFVLFALRLGTI